MQLIIYALYRDRQFWGIITYRFLSLGSNHRGVRGRHEEGFHLQFEERIANAPSTSVNGGNTACVHTLFNLSAGQTKRSAPWHNVCLPKELRCRGAIKGDGRAFPRTQRPEVSSRSARSRSDLILRMHLVSSARLIHAPGARESRAFRMAKYGLALWAYWFGCLSNPRASFCSEPFARAINIWLDIVYVHVCRSFCRKFLRPPIDAK